MTLISDSLALLNQHHVATVQINRCFLVLANSVVLTDVTEISQP